MLLKRELKVTVVYRHRLFEMITVLGLFLTLSQRHLERPVGRSKANVGLGRQLRG